MRLLFTTEVIQETIDALADVVPGLVVTTGPNPANALAMRASFEPLPAPPLVAADLRHLVR